MSRMPSRRHPIGQHAMHHQLIERRLIADAFHPLFGAIELAQSPTQATMASFWRHLIDLWPGGDYVPTVALMAEQLSGVVAWERRGR